MISAARRGPTFHGGWRLLPLTVRFVLALVRYALSPRAYPLFLLRASRGGVAAALRDIRAFHITKPVGFAGSYYTSVVIPRWPSRAFDSLVARGGLNYHAAGTAWRRHIDFVILAITRRCPLACGHCYERANLGSVDVITFECWRSVLSELQALGAGVIVLSGGEPLMRYRDLLRLIAGADHDVSELHINTSGQGLSAARARELAAAGLKGAGVGLDDPDPQRNDALRGAGAGAQALRALDALRDAGIFTYLNVCLTRGLVRGGRLPDLLELARRVGVGIVRLLEPRPVGGYAGRAMSDLFDSADRAAVVDFLKRANVEQRYAHHPLVAYPAYDEAPERLGCLMGGLGHLYIDSFGNVTPCVFVPLPFGNVQREPLGEIVARMRAAVPRPPRSECPAIRIAELLAERRVVDERSTATKVLRRALAGPGSRGPIAEARR
jgi:MoaA/NifB/PqqE/SkfB family radical SAM enzyme